ncbi:MAG: hypothetical protein ACK59A_01880 [Cyanobacteriota bacterium]
MSILFWGDSFVPILRDFTSPTASETVRSDTEASIIDALYAALAKNNIPITPLEEFITAESPPYRSQKIEFEIVVVSRQP